MNKQQHKVVIKRLTPERLNDKALNRADWAAWLNSLFVGADNISAIVGGGHCLTYDSEHHRWLHYSLPMTPEQLNDKALNRAAWAAWLNSLFVGANNISAIVRGGHSLTYDSEHHRWHHYSLSKGGWDWALARDSARLWRIVDGEFMSLDLRSGEWMGFQHRIRYKSILHAEGDAVIA